MELNLAQVFGAASTSIRAPNVNGPASILTAFIEASFSDVIRAFSITLSERLFTPSWHERSESACFARALRVGDFRDDFEARIILRGR
jgi:hypothetical protein